MGRARRSVGIGSGRGRPVSGLIAALVALAVLAVRGPGGRRPTGWRPRDWPSPEAVRPGSLRTETVPGPLGPLGPLGPPGPSGPPGAAPASTPTRGGPRRARWRRWPGRAGARDGPVDLAVVVIQVASELRSGADPGRAWERALGRPVGSGPPDRRLLETLAGPRQRSEAAAVDAAGSLAAALGAPLAQVLERIASGLAAAAEVEGERRAALAGPRATARVLTGLPALGVGLGVAVGADPVGVLLGGGIGTAALVLGATLLLIGRWWIGRLVRAAARAGQRP